LNWSFGSRTVFYGVSIFGACSGLLFFKVFWEIFSTLYLFLRVVF